MSSFMSAPFVGLGGCTSIVQRLRVGAHSLPSHFAVAFAQAFGSGRFSIRVHGGNRRFFCPNRVLNPVQTS